MNASEIQSYLRQEIPSSEGIDAASCYTLKERPGQQLLISIDTLVSGVHFPEDTPPAMIAHKALAVNLSDIASMGGEAVAYALCLACPESSSEWVCAFREGLKAIASAHNVQMLGCTVENAPLSITVQIYGYCPQGQALLRSTAQAGDLVFVSGTPGEAAGALQLLLKDKMAVDEIPGALLLRLNRPEPRLQLGMALREIASACIDISDGLLADLGHILEQSGKGAVLEGDKVPVSEILRNTFDMELARKLVLGGGDDYELCFTVSSDKANKVEQISRQLNIPCSCIGEITQQGGLRILDAQGNDLQMQATGYEHFADNA